MEKKFIVFICLLSILCWSCKTEQVEENEAQEEQEAQTNEPIIDDNALQIVDEGGYNNITLGGDIIDLEENGDLEKGSLETGEGSFDVWYFNQHDERVGYVMNTPQEQNKVSSLSITSPSVKTESGVHVGTTWEDLKQKHPNLVAHGSEVEGRVTAIHGAYTYQLDTRNWEYDMDQNKIKPDAKVEEIIITKRITNNDEDE